MPVRPIFLSNRAPAYRPRISTFLLFAGVAVYLVAVHNQTFFALAATIFGGNPWQMAAFTGMAFAVVWFTVALLSVPYLEKPVLVALVVLSAFAGYFQDRLGIRIDREMVQNLANATFRDASAVVSLDLLSRAGLTGGLPVALILWLRLRPAPVLRRVGLWLGSVVASVLLFFGLLASDFKSHYAVIRNHHELETSLQPTALIGSVIRYAQMELDARGVVAPAPHGHDAKAGPRLEAFTRPMVLVLVIGETARAANFGLNGYARDTTPLLAKTDVITFPDVRSCGTSTAVAMPCLFSHLTRETYSYREGLAHENLLDVMRHAGFDVRWFDNNYGPMPALSRANPVILTAADTPAACTKEICDNSILLPPLEASLAAAQTNTLIVLHQVGSHGPGYYQTYPTGFERFTPACNTTAFADCTDAEIVNAYDTSIAYTDVFLSKVIATLARQTRTDTAMLYVSDHGESLGEGGLYLHSAPAFMAPPEQTQVPMLFWASAAFQAGRGLSTACLRGKAGGAYSHDNLFHSVLGLANVDTSVRIPALDIFHSCVKD